MLMSRATADKFSTILRQTDPLVCFAKGPFGRHCQKRWKKPVISAKQELESRTIDLPLERLINTVYKKMWVIIRIQEKILRRKDKELSLHRIGKWKNMLKLKKPPGLFLKRYPHIFEVFKHPVKNAPFCRLTKTALDLIAEEQRTIREHEFVVVQTLKKLLMMSASRKLEIHLLRLVAKQFGFPEDLRESILKKYPQYFRLSDDNRFVELVSWDSSLAAARIEEWRKKEYEDKLLKESEIKYAFIIQFPTGFRVEKGFRERMKDWQMLPYLSPYDDVRDKGKKRRIEKRAVGIIHELLSLTVEKMMELERISHFRKPYDMELNLRELILEHPGIFYISTKGRILTVFLREAYFRGRLIEPNPVYSVRRKFMDLIEMRHRNLRILACGAAENSLKEEKVRETAGEQVHDSEVLHLGKDCSGITK